MDIMLTQMIFANNVRINVKHALKQHLSAQAVIQTESFRLIHVTAYLAFMIQLVDVKDAHINAKLVKLLLLNV